LIALRTSPPTFSAAEGERLARDLYGLAVTAKRLHGERDCNLHLRTALHEADSREFVLKVMDVLADAAGIECLSSVLELLAEQDAALPVPRIFPSETGDLLTRIQRDQREYAVCLLSYLPGTLLANVPPGRALFSSLGTQLGRMDAALQGFFHPAFARRLAWDMRQLPELMQYVSCIPAGALRNAVEAVGASMRDLLPRLRGLRSQAIHGDCHGQNVLVAADGVAVSGILDFGDMIHAPVVFEPAIAMAELRMEGLPLELTCALLGGFARHQRLTADEVELLFDLILARHACAIVLHAFRREHDAAGAQLLERAAAATVASFMELAGQPRAELVDAWHRAAGTQVDSRALPDLPRRQRLLGVGAELFYQTPLHLVRGSGVWLYDAQGNAYLDVYNNVPHVGHSHPKVARAIGRQSAVLSTHTRYLHDSILRYAAALTSRLPPHLNCCIFVNSGSEANDVAWRMAKMASGRGGALIMSHAYHGITDAIGALTPGSGEPQEPWVSAIAAPAAHWGALHTLADEEIQAVRCDTEEAIARLDRRGLKPGAWFIDSGLTSSGIFDPPSGWAAAVAATVRAAGALVVADEVQYGLGRSGSHFWGFERRGLTPDIVTLGKPIGNGFPMGVIIANRGMIEEFQRRFGFFSTFGGNPVAAEAGLAVLEVLEEEDLMANALDTGAYLQNGLYALAQRHSHLGQARGSGLLLGLPVLDADAMAAKGRTTAMLNALASRHRVLTGSEGPTGSVLKLRPSLQFRREHADRLLEAIDAVAGSMASPD
jgi:4-aminobutyrate aminotransferase-like enzyme/Ser/Thr protein kinase RdoA (MazF antagonist)